MVTIPYFQFISFPVGPLSIKVWGSFVALGILVSYWILYKIVSQRASAQWQLMSNLFFAIILGSFIGARLGHVVFYEWGYYREHLAEILAVWQGGWSSYGGFIGAAFVIAWFNRKYRHVPWAKLYDASACAFVWGWFIGRMGCFFIHDHPGIVCPTCFLGVRYPDGAVRADLGLYDGLLALFIGIIFLVGRRLKWFKRDGLLAWWLVILYTVPRFFLDFLRVRPSDLPLGDIRYIGLTPAQYMSIGFAAFALILFLRWKKTLDEKKGAV